MVWLIDNLLPWVAFISQTTFKLVVFIILPLAIPKATRGFSSIALLISSFVFGVILWIQELLLTWSIWGLGAVVIGLLLVGVGVVPIAMLATLIEGMWGPLINLVLLIILTFGSRWVSCAMLNPLDED